ncbi:MULTISPECIES: aldehyde dehydrogenase family protein [unclassified Micromonospora]|uniref:aldehyde dehydrogenase family protein n=1 Tax=unclassified Micromonospora TaxID=2617518 RepID=UPI001B35F6BC|nr:MULTISPECIES: aldehyde dehydrogenase family protein [unclassified Micromonospora]MBQ1042667.1 aldehyde dehydrogenase family protein [Micromonospora sp. C72]MBQ1057046.1 aldehyde dehydrogenase family protein [Micromonospora sp. C32]
MTAQELLAALPAGLPIGAGWATTAQTAPVRFPYDGSTVTQAPWGDPADAEAAVEAAHEVAAEMAGLPGHRRRAILTTVAAEIRARADDLAELLVLETGKPLVDCRVEVARTLVTLETAAEEVGHLTGETVALDMQPAGEGMLGFWVRRPVGVVVGITGFNYPLLLAAHKVAPSVAAGCPVIVKPAPNTPLATLVLIDLFRQAGCPAAGVQLVTGGVEVGKLLTTHPRVAAVSFTGSAQVGHQIARAAAPRKVLLELGSNAALVVGRDADLDRAAEAVVRGGFYASGQACISVQRVIVEEPVREALLERLQPLLETVTTGDPRSADTRVSALVDEASTERVHSWVDRAVAGGARCLAGGTAQGRVLQPTVLVDVPEDAECWAEEIFGPVVCVRSVPDMDAAVELVNRSRYGLQAAVFTRDLAVALDVVRRLDVGGVLVNEVPGFRADNMPYGGVKDSGIGREGPRFAMEELTVTKMVMIRP